MSWLPYLRVFPIEQKLLWGLGRRQELPDRCCCYLFDKYFDLLLIRKRPCHKTPRIYHKPREVKTLQPEATMYSRLRAASNDLINAVNQSCRASHASRRLPVSRCAVDNSRNISLLVPTLAQAIVHKRLPGVELGRVAQGAGLR